MIALLSGGDIDTIISAAASLFNVDVSEIEVRELFPAKIWIYVDEAVLDYERLEAAPLIAELMKRIAAAGVGTRVFLRTYHTARSRSYYAVPALIYNEIEAKPQDNPIPHGNLPQLCGPGRVGGRVDNCIYESEVIPCQTEKSWPL